ncbi:MAG: YbjN domain-containing protein [Candidatus Brocadiae bacterium]|nr:YbjN domain-containing protein [Candidatus Brocadiia bacterium]
MIDDSIENLVAQLRDFRSRSTASRRLVDMGRDAVGPLLEALGRERREGAKWAMLRCLGDLGAAEAVPEIAPYLEDGAYQSVAHDALVRIAGQDVGPLPGDWLRWAGQQGEPGREEVPDAAAEPSDHRLTELALEGSQASWQRETEHRYVVETPLPGGRSQKVTVIFGSQDHEGSDIVIVYADCGEAHPDDYETVLRRNLRMPYGAVALGGAAGKPRFVMFNTILRQGLSPVELRKSILTVGERSDRVARHLKH